VTAVKSLGGALLPGGLSAPLHQENVFGTPAGYAWLYPGVFWTMASNIGEDIGIPYFEA
jgi:hypothetical protein